MIQNTLYNDIHLFSCFIGNVEDQDLKSITLKFEDCSAIIINESSITVIEAWGKNDYYLSCLESRITNLE